MGDYGFIESANITEGDTDRATIHANGLVVDVIANDDGTLYIETYAYATGEQAVIEHAAIDRYLNRHPNFRVRAAMVPMPDSRTHAEADADYAATERAWNRTGDPDNGTGRDND